MEGEAGQGEDLLVGWMTREQLAEFLGLSVITLRHWALERRGPPFARLGRRILYRRESVAAWMREQEVAEKPKRKARA